MTSPDTFACHVHAEQIQELLIDAAGHKEHVRHVDEMLDRLDRKVDTLSKDFFDLRVTIASRPAPHKFNLKSYGLVALIAGGIAHGPAGLVAVIKLLLG